MILERRQLARISTTPGKTQHINQYMIESGWVISDLPGYGYAKISKKARDRWQRMIHNYLFNRENLILTFVLIDIRIPPQEIDLNFLYMLGEKEIPFAVVFTKTDKVKTAKQSENRALFEAAMYVHWESLPPMFQTSSKTREGREQLLSYIAQLNSETSN
jgi:GTP-binding protein